MTISIGSTSEPTIDIREGVNEQTHLIARCLTKKSTFEQMAPKQNEKRESKNQKHLHNRKKSMIQSGETVKFCPTEMEHSHQKIHV